MENKTEITKVPVKDLHPNPFRKWINGGKVDDAKVQKIVVNMDESKLNGLSNSLPYVLRNGKKHLVFGHNRLEAAKIKFGKNYLIGVTLQDYDDDQLLRGMVVENLTQDKVDFISEEEHIAVVYDYLKDKKKDFSPKGISKWLDEGTGKVMSEEEIKKLLNIHLNLDPELKKITEKKHDKKWKDDEGNVNRSDEGEERTTLSKTQAAMLASFQDKKEQKDLAKALMTTREFHVRNQGNLIAKYKELKKEAKKNKVAKKTIEEIRTGKKDLAEVRLPQVALDPALQDKTVKEIFIDFRRSFKTTGDFIEEIRSKNHDKKYLEKASFNELKETYAYICSWTNSKLKPFVQELIDEARLRKESEKDETIFVDFDNQSSINERRTKK
jgi:hypothetical protein